MFPSKEIAISEAAVARQMNPYIWINHYYNAANRIF